MLSQRTLRTAYFLLALLITSSANAAPLKIIGHNETSCATWITSKGSPDQRDLYLAWIGGVLTGHNYANPRQQVSSIFNGTIENLVDRYCAENPKGTFSDAALRMSDRFSGRNEPIRK